MSIFDEIKADAEAGTQGDFAKVSDHDWSLDTDGENAYFVIGPDQKPLAIIAVEQAFGMDAINDADQRRFCRLPQLERMVLEMREALQGLVALDDSYSPFGGEIHQDRIVRAWGAARAALKGGDV